MEIKGFKFGDFVLDCEDQVLLSAGKPTPLTPKAFLMLKFLVENHGRVVEKRQLLDAVWPDSFVEEGNVPYTANLLRKTLGDNKSEPRFIETIPRRGYRFIGPVTSVSVSLLDGAETDEAGDRSKWPGRPLAMATAAATILLVASVLWFASRAQDVHSAPILSRPFSVEQLSTSSNSERADISPDGKYAVYSDESGGKQSLWLRNLDSSENVQIVPPSNEEYLGLTFSNSGTSVYFVRLPQEDVHALPSLYRIDTFGGVPVKLASNVNKRISVASDDTRIAFSRCQYRKTNFCSVFVADGNGENERELMSTESGTHIWDLDFSPDGRSIAIAVGRSLNDKNDSYILEIDLETGSSKDSFSERFAKVASLKWTPDRSGILFSASNFLDGKAGIFLLDRQTGKLKTLTRDASSYQTLTLDRTGNKMIAVQQVPDYRINVVTAGMGTPLPVARDFAALPGGRIFYSTFDGEIWSINPDGTEQRQLTNTHAAESQVRVSPDKKTIYFSSYEGGNRQVWRMNADGTDRKQLTHSVGGYPLAVTADGRYLFYESTLESHLYRVSADGSEEGVAYAKRLYNMAVSPDGALVAHFFNEAMVRKIAIVDLITKETIKVLEPGPDSRFSPQLAWSTDAKALNYVTTSNGRNFLWEQTLDNARPRQIADLGDLQVLHISPAENGSFAYIAGKWRFDVMLLHGLG